MRKPTFVDLFSGAGGLSLGLCKAGWRQLLAIDYWKDALDTYRHNFPSHATWHVDISSASNQEIASRLSERPTWVVGGPPCQGFSTVGKRLKSDPRNSLFLQFCRIVNFLQPQGFVLENVLGLKDMSFVEHVRTEFRNLGYSVSFFVLKAVDYGVPQLRRRVIFIGHRERGMFQCPPPTVKPKRYVTVWDAIGDLPPLEPGQTALEYATEPFTQYQADMRAGCDQLQGHSASHHPPHLVKAISYIPDGGNRKDIPPEHQPRSGFHNSYSRLCSRAPAVAVTSNMSKPSATRCIHPFQDRGLTAREGARLQSFPDSYQFLGGGVSQRLQIANAVPPLLGEAIGRSLLNEALWYEYPVAQQIEFDLLCEPAMEYVA